MNQQNYQAYEKAQLQRQFEQEEFASVVTGLANSLSIYNVLQVNMIYAEIKHQKGKVVGKDILNLLHLLKQQSSVEQQLDAEIQFYKSSIFDLSKKGKQILNIGQFFVNFVLNNPQKGIVTQEIQEKLSQHRIVSLNKLLGLIDTIQRSRVRQREQSSKKLQGQQKSIQKAYQFNLNNSNDMSELQILKNIIIQYIPDEKMSEFCFSLLEKIKNHLADSTGHVEKLDQLQRYLEINQQKIDEEFLRYEQIINQKDYIINKQQEENEKFEEEVQVFEKQCRQDFIEAIQKLALQNSKLRQENQELAIAYEKLKFQFEMDSREVIAEAKNFELKTSPSNDTDKISIQAEMEKNKSNFESILTDELKQAYQKLNSLKIQNIDLKNRISDLQFQLQAKAGIISGHQTDRTFKNLVIEEKIPVCSSETKSKANINLNQDTKQTFLSLLRKKAMYEETGQQINKTLMFQRTNSIRLIRNVTKQYFSSQVIEEKSIQAQNYVEESRMVTSFSKISSVNQCKARLNEFDFLGLLNLKTFKKLEILAEDLNENETDEVFEEKGIFSSFITIITEKGKQEKAGFAFSRDKILFCTPQNFEVKQIIRVDILKQLIFCMNLRTWVIIKLNKCLVINGKQQNEFLISLQNRCQFLKYLERIEPSIKYRVYFEEENKICVKQGSKNCSLLSFPSAKNLLQHSVSDGQNVFEAKMSYSIVFFNKSFKVLMILSNHGIWVMQSGKNRGFQSFEEKHKLKFILPLCEDMQIIDMSQQKKIKIVYNNQKSFIVDLCSYAEAKKFKQRIKKHLEEVRQKKTKEKKKYEMKFFRSNRNPDNSHKFFLGQYIQF